MLLLIADKEWALDAGLLPATSVDIQCEECGVVGHCGVVLDCGDVALEDGEVYLVDGVLSLVQGRDGLWRYGLLRLGSGFGIEGIGFVVGRGCWGVVGRTTASSAAGMVPLLLWSARCRGAHDERWWREKGVSVVRMVDHKTGGRVAEVEC